MGWMEFIASLVDSVAWPIAGVVAVLILRSPLARLLGGTLKRLRAGPSGLELEWQEELKEIRSELDHVDPEQEDSGAGSSLRPVRLPEINLLDEYESFLDDSKRAVNRAHARLEAEIRAALSERGISNETEDFITLIYLAQREGLMLEDLASLVERVSNVRDRVERGERTLSAHYTREYVDIVSEMINAIRRLGVGAAIKGPE